jgi:hypothetical protein
VCIEDRIELSVPAVVLDISLNTSVGDESYRFALRSVSMIRNNEPSLATVFRRALLTRTIHYMFRLLLKPSSGVSTRILKVATTDPLLTIKYGKHFA